MRTPLLKVAAFAVICTGLLPACNKEDEAPDRSKLIIGSWRTTQGGSDANSNGLWDSNEHGTVDSSIAASFSFDADGNGTATGIASQVSFGMRWNLQRNDNELRIITPFGTMEDTVVHQIITLSSTDLIFRNSTDTPGYFLAMKRK